MKTCVGCESVILSGDSVVGSAVKDGGTCLTRSVVGVDGIARPAWEIHLRPWQMLDKSRCWKASRCLLRDYPVPVAERHDGADDREFAPILTVPQELILLPARDTILKDGGPASLGAWVRNQASLGVVMLGVALVSARDYPANGSLPVEVEVSDERCMDLGMKLVGAPGGPLGGRDDAVDEAGGDGAVGAPKYLYSGSYLDVPQWARPYGLPLCSSLHNLRQPWTLERVSSSLEEVLWTVVSLRCTTDLAVVRLDCACVRHRDALVGGDRSVEARRDSEAEVKPGRQRTIKRARQTHCETSFCCG